MKQLVILSALFAVMLTLSNVAVAQTPDLCAEHDCGAYGSCDASSGKASCTCSSGYTGTFCEVDVVECAGFEAPMSNYPVRVKKNRALPLKANVFDAFGYALADTDLTAPPVLQILFDSADSYAEPLDMTDQIQSVGQPDEGNQFIFTDENKWQFNLSTKNYTATGTYIVLLQSGDTSQYEVYPMCVTEFVIE